MNSACGSTEMKCASSYSSSKLFLSRVIQKGLNSKRLQSECRLMYTGADTCCQQPYALTVTCDHAQAPTSHLQFSRDEQGGGVSRRSSMCREGKATHSNQSETKIHTEDIHFALQLPSGPAMGVYCMSTLKFDGSLK